MEVSRVAVDDDGECDGESDAARSDTFVPRESIEECLTQSLGVPDNGGVPIVTKPVILPPWAWAGP